MLRACSAPGRSPTAKRVAQTPSLLLGRRTSDIWEDPTAHRDPQGWWPCQLQASASHRLTKYTAQAVTLRAVDICMASTCHPHYGFLQDSPYLSDLIFSSPPLPLPGGLRDRTQGLYMLGTLTTGPQPSSSVYTFYFEIDFQLPGN